MLVYGDMELIEKIRIYDRGIQVKSQEEIYKALVDYRMGDVSSPNFDMREALSFECEHFVDCVRNKKVPRSDGMAGLAVVRILEAASISLAKCCARVALFRGAESNAPPLPQKERLLYPLCAELTNGDSCTAQLIQWKYTKTEQRIRQSSRTSISKLNTAGFVAKF
jgi:hypothetical protein